MFCGEGDDITDPRTGRTPRTGVPDSACSLTQGHGEGGMFDHIPAGTMPEHAGPPQAQHDTTATNRIMNGTPASLEV